MFPQRNSEEIVDLINTFVRLLETASRLPAGAERQAIIAPIQDFHERLGRLVLRQAVAIEMKRPPTKVALLPLR
jgi:hypothetical protein